MKYTLQSIFTEYSYLSDKEVLENLLEKVDNKSLKKIKSLQDLNKFLFQLNKKVEKRDLLSILFKLQANIQIMDYALTDYEDDLAFCMKTLNLQNIRFIEEIVGMLDFRELGEEKEI